MVTAISKRFCCIIGILLILSFVIPQAHAAVQSVFGPNQYVRTNGNPNVYTDSFSAASGQGTITIFNGDENGNNRVTSASILLNGVEIFGPNNFKKKIYVLEAQVNLQVNNTIEIILRSKPGSYLTIRITQEIANPSVNISANPTAIQLGGSSILTWSSTNANSCVIEPGIGSVGTSGSVTVSPSQTTTYTVTATGSGGTATDDVTITVHQPPTVSISANPNTILLGQSATLSWASTNANSCVIEPGIGPVDPNGSLTVSPTETTTYTITATGPGGTATGTAMVTVHQSPTVSINAVPDTILLSESATLSWTSTNADSATIDQGIGSVAVNGSTSVSPTTTTTYTITVTGPGGTDTASVTVTITYPAPAVNISANPESIQIGGSSTLTWSSANANSCVIEPGIGSVNPSGSLTVSPTVTTTYTITATGLGGTATGTATVTVHQPPTVSINASPDTILLSESATLSWTSTNADMATIDQGIGSVAVNGSTSVSPTATTTYTIAVTGPGGTATASATVTITYPVPTVSISASPSEIQLGESSTLTWSSTNANSCVIEPEIGSVNPSGSLSVSPAETTTYIITATGSGGTAVSNVIVTVNDPNAPPIVSIDAQPSTIELGESSVLSWNSTNAESTHIDNGIGIVAQNGSITVTPEFTTIYTISVTGPNGSDSAQVIVTVLGNPEPQPEGSFGKLYENQIPPNATIEAYDSKRFSLITGQVNTIDEMPISDVLITVLGKPEYGTTLTDIDGRFTIPVEGGSTMTIQYQKQGLLAAHRQVYVPWNDIATAETIQMIVEDPISTVITFDGNPNTVVTHQSTPFTDEFGIRSTTLVFTGDNHAELVDENGNVVQTLHTITARVTVYPDPQTMPAVLPPNSAFTYCAEFVVDGAQRVKFSKPVTGWIENHHGFDIGEIVPVGYYDRDKGVWIPSDNGVVVQLLDIDNDGIVDAIDASGDGQPDDLDVDGTYSSEIIGIENGNSFTPGATFWRFSISHFSPWDFNWPFGPPEDAIEPNPYANPDADQQNKENSDCKGIYNSFVEERSRIFHEDIPVAGTDMMLHYASNRVKGFEIPVNIPASGEIVPGSLKRIIVKAKIAGRILQQTLDPLPGQKAELSWDGLDYLGNEIHDSVTANISIGFIYNAVYYRSSSLFYRSFAKPGRRRMTAIRADMEVILSKKPPDCC